MCVILGGGVLAEFTHLVRPHWLSGVQTYELEDDGLSVRAGAGVKRIPYAEVEGFSLISYANAGQQSQCTIRTRSRGKLNVRSHHFVALGRFEDRTATYTPFVRELCRRVHAKNPGARFIQGSRAIQIIWLIALVGAAFAWFAWIAAAREGAHDVWTSALSFAALVFFTVLGVRGFRSNAPQDFDPSDPPLP